ncbi:MAG: phosphodiester glycosidase family protein [Clostridiales bacterium]|nr:phosphodiester glycosidase family protein [Clostridiales bacterium]
MLGRLAALLLVLTLCVGCGAPALPAVEETCSYLTEYGQADPAPTAMPAPLSTADGRLAIAPARPAAHFFTEGETPFREYASDTLIIQVEEVSYAGTRVLAARVWVAEPDRQIRKAGAVWQESLAFPSELETEDAVFLVNGSGFSSPEYPNRDSRYNGAGKMRYTSLGFLVRTDGEVLRELPEQLFTGMSATDDGLRMYEKVPITEVEGANTWAFLDVCYFIKGGQADILKPYLQHEQHIVNERKRRTLVCRIDANHYLFVCVQGDTKKGLTLEQATEFCLSYEPRITDGFCLDGGQSVAMVLAGEVLAGNATKVFDILYLTD